MIYTNPHSGQVMKAVYVDSDKLRAWDGEWIPTLVDYSKPFGVIGLNHPCDCAEPNCKYHEPIYELIQHTFYPDGVLFSCPVSCTREANG